MKGNMVSIAGIGTVGNSASYKSNKMNKYKRADLNNPVDNPSLGIHNAKMAKIRIDPLAYYVHIMAASFDPVYGRENSLAAPRINAEPSRFPLAEEQREHDRSENNNSPAKVYNIADHPAFKPANEDSDKEKKQNYESYNTSYKKKKYDTKAYNPTKKKDDKSIYKISTIVKALEDKAKKYFSKKYIPKHDDDNAKPIYEGIAEKVSYLTQKAVEYLKRTEYGSKQVADYGNIIDFSNYVKPVSYDNDNNISKTKTLEELLAA